MLFHCSSPESLSAAGGVSRQLQNELSGSFVSHQCCSFIPRSSFRQLRGQVALHTFPVLFHSMDCARPTGPIAHTDAILVRREAASISLVDDGSRAVAAVVEVAGAHPPPELVRTTPKRASEGQIITSIREQTQRGRLQLIASGLRQSDAECRSKTRWAVEMAEWIEWVGRDQRSDRRALSGRIREKPSDTGKYRLDW
jgi:hypothetical protein